MDEAEALCDRVAIIDHGRLLQHDTPAALVAAHSEGGNLEDVFLALTGREYRA
jgi:ABC-2 type transport system ATP-binding protein